MHWNTILAQAAPAAGSPAQPVTAGTTGTPPSPLQQLLFGSPIFLYVLVFVAIYFMFLRPSSQQRKRQAEMLKALKSGDKIVTTSGIIGTVISVKDETVSLRSADAKMEVTKASVSQLLERSSATEVKPS
jgi:preprotein translocase subunit YajC